MDMIFSDRYGYTTPREVLIVEDMPQEVENAICSALDDLKQDLYYKKNKTYPYYTSDNDLTYGMLEKLVWRFYLKRRETDLKFNYDECQEVTTAYILDTRYQWYEKLNLLEFVIVSLAEFVRSINGEYRDICVKFIDCINRDFKNLGYGYRIIKDKIVQVTDPIEIDSIIEAMQGQKDNVHVHIESALSHFAKRPEPDYRNSIKESISAVECLCREITKKSTLDDAIPVLKSKGVQLNPQFEEGLKKMYFYTNDKRTGIRHALMDGSYVPTMADAKYMLVICSAFVNYIRSLIPA